MLNWLKARDYLASLFASPSWGRLSEENRRIGTAAITMAVERCWDALDPSLRRARAAILIKESITPTVEVKAGDRQILFTSAVAGDILHQTVFIGEDAYTIMELETVPGGVRAYLLNDVIRADYQGPAVVEYRSYLLPHDFDGFDEIPADTLPRSESVFSVGGLTTRPHEFLGDPSMIVDDYVPETGRVDVEYDMDQRRYKLTGDGTLWTADLAGQILNAGGRTFVIRSVDVPTQVAYSWVNMTDDTSDVDVQTGLPYELILQGRRMLNVLVSNQERVQFYYRKRAPEMGMDHQTIPIPSDKAVRLWIQWYWMVTSDDGSTLATNVEKQLLRQDAENALADLGRSSRAYPGGIETYELNADSPPIRAQTDPRIRYEGSYGTGSSDARRAFSRPDRRYGESGSRARHRRN